MTKRILAQFLCASVFGASAGHAACTVSSDSGAAVRRVEATNKADATLLISMSLLPKLMHLDYASAGARPPCEIGPLTGAADYMLWGDDGAGRQRVAVSSKGGSPIALMMPVSDVEKMIAASGSGKPAPVEGYLLATVSPSDFTGWRFYTGMPDAATLKHDMGEVLAAPSSPIFRNDAAGKTQIFMPPK